MPIEHRALVHWSPEQVERGLPAFTETTDPAWIEGATPGLDEGWTLICIFDSPPARQGSPSAARVRFLVDGAPHESLRAGSRLLLYEPATQRVAQFEILD